MNCKPGDLAYIARASQAPLLLGRVVTVLMAAPVGQAFNLPDGWPHLASQKHGYWVCEFAAPISAPTSFGGPRLTQFGCIHDTCLRPIRDPGDDAQDETLAWKQVPLPTIQPELLDA